MQNRFLPVVAAACLAAQACAAEAGDPAQVVVTGQRTITPPSTTATRTAVPWLEDPQSSQVVPRDVIQDQSALDLTAAVRNVAGVQTDFSFDGLSSPLLILRGFPSVSSTARSPMSGSATYYLDGTKVTGVPIDMTTVQAVEVVKGPAGVLYGRAEPGGLVNVVSRPFARHPQWEIEQVAGAYGLRRSAASVSGPLGADDTLLGRVAFGDLVAGSARDFVEDRLRSLSAGVQWQPGAGTRLAALAGFSEQGYRTDYGIPARGDRSADLPRARQFNDSPYLSSVRTSTLRLTLDQDFGPAWKLAARYLALHGHVSDMNIAPHRVDRHLTDAPADRCPGTGDPLCRYYSFVRPDGTDTIRQLNADLVGTLGAGDTRHTVLLGLDSYRATRSGTTYMAQVGAAPIEAPLPARSGPLDLARAKSYVQVDDTRWDGIYLQDQVALSSQAFVTAAVRRERTSAVFDAPGTAPNVAWFTTPRLGTVWKLAPGQALYAQYQSAIGANNGRDPVTHAALAAERARQFEVGHKLERGGIVSTIALYELVKRNRAESVPATTAPFYSIVTVGAARSRGLEWGATARLAAHTVVMASYAYTDAQVTEGGTLHGKRLANVGRHSASLWLRRQLGSAWAAGAGLFVQDQRQGDVRNTFQLPGYARLDAMLSYVRPVGRARATVQLNVDNLFDRRYYVSSHQFVQDWIRPGAPRTARMTLRLEQ